MLLFLRFFFLLLFARPLPITFSFHYFTSLFLLFFSHRLFSLSLSRKLEFNKTSYAVNLIAAPSYYNECSSQEK
jgi:hypothetical protein